MNGIKNIEKAKVLTLKDEVVYQQGAGREQDAGAEQCVERDVLLHLRHLFGGLRFVFCAFLRMPKTAYRIQGIRFRIS